MKISIITAAYNEKAHICEAIESVINQDYADIEYIIIEGNSTDGTLNVIKKYESKISILISESDRGLYDALNKGILNATGDYIGFVHANDMLSDSTIISKVVDKIKETNCDILYADGIYVPDGNSNNAVRRWTGGIYTKCKIKHGWLPLHPTMYIKRDIYLNHGLYNISYRIAGDTDLLLRYLYNGNFNVAYLNECVIKMRMGGMSTSILQTLDKWAEDIRAYHCIGLSFYCVIGKILRKIPQFLSQRFFYKYLLENLIEL